MTDKNKHIPQGYKDSPLGIIPKEWEVKKLGDLCIDIYSGKNKVRVESGTYPVYGSTGIIGKTDEYKYDGDRILVARVGAHAGQVSSASGKYDVSDNTIIVENKEHYSQYFAYQQLIAANLNKLVFGSGQPLITAGMLKRMYVICPPPVEQEKINAVLKLWDTAIEKQSKLIEKLKLRKRALMQQLLTGQKRLPGFSGEWKEIKLGDIGFAYSGLVNKNKDDFENGNAKYIPYTNVFSNNKIDIDDLGQVQIMLSERQEQVKRGDIFFTVSSETPEEVGMASVLLNEVHNTYLNSFCFGYRLYDFETVIPQYVSYLFRGYAFRKEMFKIAQGSTRYNISKAEVMKMRITLPSIEEQNVIVYVLAKADKEIEIAEDKLLSLQSQKRGLMQQLLTGKKRIMQL